MSSITRSPNQDFADAVRAELADLSREEIADLTDDLEAAINDRLAEEGEHFNPGSPAEYAAEMRAAAGLPAPKTGRRRVTIEAINARSVTWFRKRQFTSVIFDFGLTLRPFWWVLRAYVAWLLFFEAIFFGGNSNRLLPKSSVEWLFLIAIMVVSVQLGRNRWFTSKFFQVAVLPLNILALVLVPVSIGVADQRETEITYLETYINELPATDGLRINGQAITDLKVLDTNGQLVADAIIQDQNGLPVIAYGKTDPALLLEVPDLKGLNLNQAIASLNRLGFGAVDINYLVAIDSSNQNAAVVEYTTPLAGAKIAPDVVLTLNVGAISR